MENIIGVEVEVGLEVAGLENRWENGAAEKTNIKIIMKGGMGWRK